MAAQGIKLIRGNLDNIDALQQLVAGTAAVIHAAGAVRGSCKQDFDHINVTGTAQLVTALSGQTPPPRLLLLSSLAARESQLSWYAASKRAAETLLEERPDLDWTILRPPAVYGPGDKEMLPVFRTMTRGIAPLPGRPEARISLIHVSDLVAAIVSCLQTDACRHRTLTLCDGKAGGYDWRDMADLVGSIWGCKVRLWRVPGWLLDSVAYINLQSGRLTGRPAMLTPPKLRELRHPDWVVDNSEITKVTGWSPLTGLKEGLELLRKAEL